MQGIDLPLTLNGLVLLATALPHKLPKLSDSSQKCPTVSKCSLMRVLGAGQNQIQHFTPDTLCLQTRLSRSPPLPMFSEVGSTTPYVVSQDGPSFSPSQAEESLIPRVASCTSEQLSSLIAEEPSENFPCAWRFTCQYDPNRFPATLYQAERTGNHVECPGEQRCRSVYRRLWLLRKRVVGNCPSWKRSLEKVTISYECR